MYHWPDRQIVLHHALRAIAQVGADITRNIGRRLAVDLTRCSRRQGADQGDQRGGAEALRETGVDKPGGASTAEFVSTEGADLHGLIIRQGDPVPGDHDARLGECDIGTVAPDQPCAARDQDTRSIDRMDVFRDDGADRAGQCAVEGRLCHSLNHGALNNRVRWVRDHFGTCHLCWLRARTNKGFICIQTCGFQRILPIRTCAHPGEGDHRRRDTLCAGLGFGCAPPFEFGQPQFFFTWSQ